MVRYLKGVDMGKMIQSISDLCMIAKNGCILLAGQFSRRSNEKVDMCRIYILQGVIFT